MSTARVFYLKGLRDTSYKAVVWIGCVVFVGLLPIFVTVSYRYLYGFPIDLVAILARGDLFLLACAILGGVYFELLFRRSAKNPAGRGLAIFMATFLLLLSAIGYTAVAARSEVAATAETPSQTYAAEQPEVVKGSSTPKTADTSRPESEAGASSSPATVAASSGALFIFATILGLASALSDEKDEIDA